MGHEVAGGLGVRLAFLDSDLFLIVGDGSYLLMITELATAVQESAEVLTVQGEFADAIKVAKAADGPIVIYVETVPLLYAPSPRSWSDVPLSSASTLGPTWPPSELDRQKNGQKIFLTATA